MNDQFVSVREAAEILKLTTRQVTRLASSGRLPYVHKNPTRTGSYTFRLADVEAHRESRKERAA